MPVLLYTASRIYQGCVSMEEKTLKSWSEFKPTIDEIRRKYGYHEYIVGEDQSLKFKNVILFRGQRNSTTWNLKTTLERRTQKVFSLLDYYSLIVKSVNELESYIGTKWNIASLQDIVTEIETKQNEFAPFLPHYDYLVYLRHHEYPSPLLDWTESPYIAAYFAMCETSSDERVAIYTYTEMPNGDKSVSSVEPQITQLGPRVRTDKRHFAQKAWYTVATKWSKENSQHVFCSHHEIFDNPKKDQDILIKITIPAVDRKLALKELYDYNISHFTLFQNEDSLIKTLSMKDFDITD
jgi:hypothetical protein